MTDQSPRGKLSEADEGQLEYRVGVMDKTVIIDFGKPVVWLGLDYDSAINLANVILKRAIEIKPKGR